MDAHPREPGAEDRAAGDDRGLSAAGSCLDGGLPIGGLPIGGRPNGGRPERDGPDGDRPDGDRPDGDRPDGGWPDGGWTGFDQDERRALRQDLHLTFAGGLVAGIGIDGMGEFLVDGRYDQETSEVTLTKSYPGRPGRPRVCYRGFREVHGIWGLQEGGGAGSGFHIWPQSQTTKPASDRGVAAGRGALPSWLFRI